MQPRVSLSGPWYRIQSIAAPSRSSSAEWDFVTVLPAALSAAARGRITNGGPRSPPRQPRRSPEAPDRQAGPQPLLFPGGARGVELDEGYLADLADLVWTPCPGRQAPPLGGRREPDADELK